MKKAKPIYRYDMWMGTKSFASAWEKSISQDSMHKPYVRNKRTKPNLPDNWKDTKRLKKYKSWKHRSKKKYQWEKHKEGLTNTKTIKIICDFCKNSIEINRTWHTFSKICRLLIKDSYKNSIYCCNECLEIMNEFLNYFKDSTVEQLKKKIKIIKKLKNM